MRCWTARVRSSGTRRRTASTPRRRSWPGAWGAEHDSAQVHVRHAAQARLFVGEVRPGDLEEEPHRPGPADPDAAVVRLETHQGQVRVVLAAWIPGRRHGV